MRIRRENLAVRIRRVEVKNHPFCNSHIMASLLAHFTRKDSNHLLLTPLQSLHFLSQVYVTFHDEGK